MNKQNLNDVSDNLVEIIRHRPNYFYTFAFDFGETVTTKGGRQYNLQDLQDTAVSSNISIDDVLDILNGKGKK